jgi:hypothetical protein
MEAELIRDWGLLPQREFENCWEFPPLIDARKVGWDGRLQHTGRSGETDVVGQNTEK